MADKKTAKKTKRKSVRKKAAKKKTTRSSAKKTEPNTGRPPTFDEDGLVKLKKLMLNYPSLKDTACFFDCAVSTVEETIRKHYGMAFKQFRDIHMGHTRLRLKQVAIRRAEAGSDRMLQFCLTNLCGWKTKVENTNKDENPRSVSGAMVEGIMKDPKLAAAMLKVAEKTAAEESEE